MQTEATTDLPQPDDLSAAHSARVAEHLCRKIAAAGGVLSFAEFMHEVLYAPGLGYYSAGSTKFGSSGDFVTAPEVSPVFGRILARQCAEVLSHLSDGEVLEIGAGSGRLAVDLLTTLAELDELPTRYRILEVSAELVEKQRATLQRHVPELIDRVEWLSAFPSGHSGVVVANEVLDALPVERFVRSESGVEQCCVAVDAGEFAWSHRPAKARLSDAVDNIEHTLGATLEPDYTSEVSLAAPAWIAQISECLRHGAVFLFDYGLSTREYYAPDRNSGWLRCHFRHHAHSDPLILPGIQDVTAWVDFSSVAEAAVDNGMDVLAYQTQAQFLMGGGIAEEMQPFENLSTRDQLKLSSQIKTLTLPGEMGENFKCMVLGKGQLPALSAHQFADRTHTL